MRSRIAALAATLLVSALAAGQALTGTVTNKTSGKPAAGDDVVLLNLAQGMSEAARTKTDARGHFSFASVEPGPHLVRVNHQNVNYFSPAPPGFSSVDVTVYDVAKKLDGVSGNVDVVRVQSDGSSLQVMELYAVNNTSNPPRTLMSDRPFEFYLPEGAQLDQTAARAPNGNGVNVSAVPEDEKGRYYIIFPLRPGETQFQVAYHLPYSGQFTFQPRLVMPYQHIAVTLPKSMQFAALAPGTYSPMNDESGGIVQVSNNLQPGKGPPFRVSGTGTLQEEAGAQQPAQAGGQSMPAGPGGGLGAPIDTPDPLHNYRWAILAGVCAALVGGAFYVLKVQKPALAAGNSTLPEPVARRTAVANRPAVVVHDQSAQQVAVRVEDRSVSLLDELKEEIFQLEVDRQQGRISSQEYAAAKAALDKMLKRAVARRA